MEEEKGSGQGFAALGVDLGTVAKAERTEVAFPIGELRIGTCMSGTRMDGTN